MAPKHNTVTYLIDNQGHYVHQWKSEYEPGQTVYLLPNGHLLRSCMVRVQGGVADPRLGGNIREMPAAVIVVETIGRGFFISAAIDDVNVRLAIAIVVTDGH